MPGEPCVSSESLSRRVGAIKKLTCSVTRMKRGREERHATIPRNGTESVRKGRHVADSELERVSGAEKTPFFLMITSNLHIFTISSQTYSRWALIRSKSSVTTATADSAQPVAPAEPTPTPSGWSPPSGDLILHNIIPAVLMM